MYAKSWKTPWISQALRDVLRRMRMEPVGKSRTKASEARMPWARMTFWLCVMKACEALPLRVLLDGGP